MAGQREGSGASGGGLSPTQRARAKRFSTPLLSALENVVSEEDAGTSLIAEVAAESLSYSSGSTSGFTTLDRATPHTASSVLANRAKAALSASRLASLAGTGDPETRLSFALKEARERHEGECFHLEQRYLKRLVDLRARHRKELDSVRLAVMMNDESAGIMTGF